MLTDSLVYSEVNKTVSGALAGVAQWIECQPVNQMVTSLIPSQGTCQVPSGEHVRGNHTLMFLSLFFPLTSPLSKNK